MRTSFFVVSSLALLCNGRRVQTAKAKFDSSSHDDEPQLQSPTLAGSTYALKKLALLCLASHPTSSWQIRGMGQFGNQMAVPRDRTRRLASPAQMRSQLQANSWQARLDKALLNIDVKPQARFRLLQRALQDPELISDLSSAVETIQGKGFGKGHPEVIEKLWPKGTIARSDLEGFLALRTQVPEVLEDLQQRVPFQPASGSAPAPPLPEPTEVFNFVSKFVTDSEFQKELREEAKDSLRRTPKSLETPKYAVVRTLEIDKDGLTLEADKIELRRYPEFTVAKTRMDKFGFGSSSGSIGFNTLASYLFGKNEANEEMKMTMPVEISIDGGDEGSMSFVLPKVNSDAPPEPLASSDVTIETVPERLVAAKTFGGIVTDQEVERQKALMLEALAADDSITPVDDSRISVLQYNSPFTIPWRRRNEVAIVVTEKVVEAAETTATIESTDEATAETDQVTSESVVESAAESEAVSEKEVMETEGVFGSDRAEEPPATSESASA